MDKLHINIDASALSNSSCFLRFYNTVVKGYRAPLNTNDVEFGSAFHLFVATMRHTKSDIGKATHAALERFRVPMIIKSNKKYLTENYLINLCHRFWELYASKDDFATVEHNGELMAEIKFSWPYYEDDNSTISLCGTLDDVCKHQRGTYALRDYKTTSITDVKPYLRGYYMSPQLLMYRLMVRYYASKYTDSIWAEINRLNVACFVDGIFLHGKDKDPEFVRSDVFFFTDSQLDEFDSLLRAKVERLVEHLSLEIMPQREGLINGSCVTKFGLCPFFDACASPDNISAEHLLRRNFIQKPYDPLTF